MNKGKHLEIIIDFTPWLENGAVLSVQGGLRFVGKVEAAQLGYN